MSVRLTKSYQREKKVPKNVLTIRRVRYFYPVSREKEAKTIIPSMPCQQQRTSLSRTKNWDRSIVEMLLRNRCRSDVRSDGLNCDHLNRSPADRLLARGNAGKGRVLAGLESTDLIQRNSSLNLAASECFWKRSTYFFLSLSLFLPFLSVSFSHRFSWMYDLS